VSLKSSVNLKTLACGIKTPSLAAMHRIHPSQAKVLSVKKPSNACTHPGFNRALSRSSQHAGTRQAGELGRD
jgi:hypothetical protein